jgi:hypothetical protein
MADDASTESREGKEQLNLKLPRDRYAVLVAAAYVRGASNLRSLVLPVVDAFIDELAQDEAVQLAMKAREINDAREAGSSSRLRRSTMSLRGGDPRVFALDVRIQEGSRARRCRPKIRPEGGKPHLIGRRDVDAAFHDVLAHDPDESVPRQAALRCDPVEVFNQLAGQLGAHDSLAHHPEVIPPLPRWCGPALDAAS